MARELWMVERRPRRGKIWRPCYARGSKRLADKFVREILDLRNEYRVVRYLPEDPKP